jgi:hypothetical protein
VPGEADRQHDHQAGVEEDREAKEQRGDGQGQRCTLLAELVDQRIGRHLGSDTGLEHAPEHGAQADEQGHGGQRAAEAAEAAEAAGEGGYHRCDRDAGCHGRQQRNDDQRHERVDAPFDYEQKQQQDRAHGDGEERRGAQRPVHD